jgi:hypothetical protein
MSVAVALVGSGVMALVGVGISGDGGGIMQALHRLCRACGSELDGWCGGDSRSPDGGRVSCASVPRLLALEQLSASSSCTIVSSLPQSSAGPKIDGPS